ncbi:MAG TPA: hypothetical protein VFP88_00225 [Rhodanobacteraceae bacterium]|nr:hypothetical protein [Rhodanobacteraceae bacterium]
MDAFSYLSVLLSIILGLAITQILQGFRDLMQARSRLRLYWPSLLWAITLLVICVQEWWAMFGWRDHKYWTFAGFSTMLAQTVATYLVAALALPDVRGDEPIDLHAYYYANHRWFFSLLAIAVAISMGKEVVLSGHLPDPPLNSIAQAVFIILSIIGALTARERYHKLLAPLGAILFGAYIAVLFMHLR